MMARLRFGVVWDAPPEDEAYGPEIPTWAKLTVDVDGRSLTRNTPIERFAAETPESIDYVAGPLSGLAEWFVDHFAEVLWDFGVPFPKLDGSEQLRAGVPGLQDAAGWWSKHRDQEGVEDLATVAKWQRRHTVGVAASQVALPSLVLVPEPDRVGLFVERAPDQHDPGVRIEVDSFNEFWLDRSELRSEIGQFVDGVMDRAAETAEGATWARWLGGRWTEAQRREQDTAVRRSLAFGELVSSMWDARIAGSAARPAIEGLLYDVRRPTRGKEVDCLIAVAETQLPRRDTPGWRDLRKIAGTIGGARPAHEGYRMAVKVREHLRLGVGPIPRVDVDVLANLDVNDTLAESQDLFRAAAIVRDRSATVVLARENTSLAWQRVARATALGRVLFDSRGASWGAAVGTHARWLETRRASAFAAELLAPASVVRARYLDDPNALADDYGISRAAAHWRIHNARQSQDWAA